MKLQPKIVAKHVLTQMLQKSLEILQLPQIELAALILEEVGKNPLLELECNSTFEPFCPQGPTPSIHEHLSAQMREALPGVDAEKLLAELDEHGFLARPAEELAELLQVPLAHMHQILRTIKTFDPPGVFARNLQEAFLLQLDPGTLSYRLVEENFEDLLARRFALLKKKFPAHLQEALRQIGKLKTRPLEKDYPVPPIYPDFRAEQVDGVWVVSALDEMLPKFRRIAFSHASMRPFIATAKWLLRSIQRRKDLLTSIAKYLTRKQSSFFEGEPKKLSAQVLANEFGVHESTIFRAIAGKYIETPRGTIPLRLLITDTPNRKAKAVLQHLIEQESEPLTDEKLAAELKKMGYAIARRTIAKYRKELKIRAASSRKHLV